MTTGHPIWTMRRFLVTTCALLLCAPAVAKADAPTRVLVRFAADTSSTERADIRDDANVQRDASLPVSGLELVDPDAGVSVKAAVADLNQTDGVLYAEPDRAVQAAGTPNDPFYRFEWDMDTIRAPAAWDVTTGSASVPIAVVDTGIEATHPDLASNIWTNPGEVPGNGIDDDHNGRVDDVHGWDFVQNDALPQDGNGHGTHVSGTIAARGNDGAGVAGLNWTAGLMPLRVLNNSGSGRVSDAISAYAYAARTGARVVNASLGGSSFSQAEHDAIAAAPNTLFVVAAGNDTANDDTTPEYPCDYDLANVICVAASDRDDSLASFSNYGARNVDLAAPGVDIASTYPGSTYMVMSGTSMATPHVAGAAGLLLAQDPSRSVASLRAALLSSVDAVAALSGRVATGGRLDVAAALAVPPLAASGSGPSAVPAPATAPAPSSPTTTTPAVDRTAPKVALSIAGSHLRLVRARGVRVTVTSSEACRVTLALVVDKATARRLHLRSRTIGHATVRLTKAGKRVVTVRLSSRAARALSRAAKVRVLASAVAVDGAGNRRNAQRAKTLHR